MPSGADQCEKRTVAAKPLHPGVFKRLDRSLTRTGFRLLLFVRRIIEQCTHQALALRPRMQAKAVHVAFLVDVHTLAVDLDKELFSPRTILFSGNLREQRRSTLATII